MNKRIVKAFASTLCINIMFLPLLCCCILPSPAYGMNNSPSDELPSCHAQPSEAGHQNVPHDPECKCLKFQSVLAEKPYLLSAQLTKVADSNFSLSLLTSFASQDLFTFSAVNISFWEKHQIDWHNILPLYLQFSVLRI